RREIDAYTDCWTVDPDSPHCSSGRRRTADLGDRPATEGRAPACAPHLARRARRRDRDGSRFRLRRRSNATIHPSHPLDPAIGASYAVGVNGLGLTMVLLAAVLTPVVIAAAWNEVKLPEGVEGDDALVRRQAGYMALVLVLLALMIAVFAARDVFFFYVLFEAMLVPVYFMIGVYGGPNRRAASIKFLLYSLAGGLLMLAGVIALYFYTDGGPQAYLIENASGVLEAYPTLQLWIFLSFFVAF